MRMCTREGTGSVGERPISSSFSPSPVDNATPTSRAQTLSGISLRLDPGMRGPLSHPSRWKSWFDPLHCAQIFRDGNAPESPWSSPFSALLCQSGVWLTIPLPPF